jgi:ATP-grasp domain
LQTCRIVHRYFDTNKSTFANNNERFTSVTGEIGDLSGTEFSVLIVAAKWWPSSARLASVLSRRGCRVHALCPAHHPLTYISGLQGMRRYGAIASLATLRRALIETRPDVVIPCDDGVVAQLHELHRREPPLRHLIESSIGPPESYPIVSNRYLLLDTARQLGIRVPETRVVAKPADLENWHETMPATSVLKVDGESGGNGVRISDGLDQSLAALSEFATPISFSTSLKRHLIDKDPLAFWASRRKHPREVTVQEFIPGRPANSMILCREGKVLSALSVQVVASEGPTGAATIVSRIDNESMTQAGVRIAARLNLTGFFGLDFVLAPDSQNACLIELNPRCTQLGHLEFSVYGSLADVFRATWRGEPLKDNTDRPIGAETIALFPQARAAGGICEQLVDLSFHDVPWDEPRLVSELMRGSWPQRRRLARLYHAFRPLRRSHPLVFEPIETLAMRERLLRETCHTY